jgi:hypothetical protein
MKKIIVTTTLLCSTIIALCQSTPNCEVLLEPIKGKYDGACNNNKANGLGKSEGIDTYLGNFKNGLPDGEGVYTWINGDYYKGNFKKGQKNGKGELHYINSLKVDSIFITGYWKKDKYFGLYENTYELINVPSCVTSKDITKNGDKKNNITFSFFTGNLGNADASSYVVKLGSYANTTTMSTPSRIESVTFRDVTFPFRIEFGVNCTKGTSQLELIINEGGDWNVDVTL